MPLDFIYLCHLWFFFWNTYSILFMLKITNWIQRISFMRYLIYNSRWRGSRYQLGFIKANNIYFTHKAKPVKQAALFSAPTRQQIQHRSLGKTSHSPLLQSTLFIFVPWSKSQTLSGSLKMLSVQLVCFGFWVNQIWKKVMFFRLFLSMYNHSVSITGGERIRCEKCRT